MLQNVASKLYYKVSSFSAFYVPSILNFWHFLFYTLVIMYPGICFVVTGTWTWKQHKLMAKIVSRFPPFGVSGSDLFQWCHYILFAKYGVSQFIASGFYVLQALSWEIVIAFFTCCRSIRPIGFFSCVLQSARLVYTNYYLSCVGLGY